ncbi:alpha-amylase family protein [Motilibacter deserti]|uniref:Alpha-amylase n=1 Tax=Motilibacter deserti TaxID=2714956 RepID=A0ABX0H2V8_9ACTN|nr:trehalose synthase [Motilibacter deserti]
MRTSETADVWWKSAVVYCLDVETYLDWDGDGYGDFAGLTQRVDYLADLGVTCVWLMPFYPSPERDDGYDITDFYSVDPRLGTLGDLVEFVRTARDRGIRVIADLVVNHTSVQHPWFQSARSSRDSPYRDWYVWRDEPPANASEGVVFPDVEDSVWTYDEEAGQYYQHQFYRQQPDLNITNPAVRNEIARITSVWTQLGLSGFRVDAVPFLLETGAVPHGDEKLPRPHDYLRDLRTFLTRRDGGVTLLGEVNLPYDQTAEFFGSADGDELTVIFDFNGMQALWLAMARQDSSPLVHAVRARPEPPKDCQWATFVRNHDELTLDKLTLSERQEVFDAFGPKKSMQLYDRGLRRRVPPMLDGDQDRVRLVYSMLFALPGTPTLFYGEEIGMGEDLRAEGRMAVRTPMQWTPEPNGGFSPPGVEPARATIPEGDFGPEQVNVRDQRRDPGSLLTYLRTLISRYRECPELSWGSAEVLETDAPGVLVLRNDWERGTVVTLHNLAADRVDVTVPLLWCEPGSRVVDLDTTEEWPVPEDGSLHLSLGRYGHRWLRVLGPRDRMLV